MMIEPFTIGIEEEFQVVNRSTGLLSLCIQTLLDRGRPLFGEHIKAETFQSTVEFISGIFPDIASTRLTMRHSRSRLLQLVNDDGLALVSAGTHPIAQWQDELLAPDARYTDLKTELQDVLHFNLIFGLHIHIGVKNQEVAVMLMNQLRTWLPHLLAFASNSPFWAGHPVGFKSFRPIVRRTFPRNGIPEVFPGWDDFDRYIQTLIKHDCIDNGRRIWWDIRPHPFFNTIEFRICDMPTTLDDTIALAALCQALVAKVSWLNQHGIHLHMLPTHFIDENKWCATRDGIDATLVDFVQGRRIAMRQALNDLLDFVNDVAHDLGSYPEMHYLRSLLEDTDGTGADRQLAVYRETGNLDAVVQCLITQTATGL